MKGRPLCVASAVFAITVFIIYTLFFPPQKTKNNVSESAVLTGRIEQISHNSSGNLSLVLRDVIRENTPFCERIKVYAMTGSMLFDDLKIGQTVSVNGTVSTFSIPGNPGQFNEWKYYKEQGISYRFFAETLTLLNDSYDKTGQWLYEIREQCICHLYKNFPENEAGIIAAMLFGDRAGLAKETKNRYQINGMAHILAISGLHISLIGSSLFYFLRRFVMPMKAAACLTALFLFLYGILTGFSVSASRAIIMMICMLSARFVGKRYDRLSALALAAMICLVFSPDSLFQNSFLLSYGTVLGLTILIPVFSDSNGFSKKMKPLLEAFFSAFSAFLVTFPILLYYNYECNVYSIAVNMLILPFAGALILMGAVGNILSFICQSAGNFFSGTAYFILKYYDAVCFWAEKLPGSRIITGQPDLWQLFTYYLFLISLCHPFFYKKTREKTMILLLAFLIIFFPKTTDYGLIITNLDVGQGDCSCLEIGEECILIDGGSSDVDQPGKYRIVPFLKCRGIKHISCIFVSHSDQDHVNGISEIIKEADHFGLKIGTVILPDIVNPDEAYLEFCSLCRDSDITLKTIHTGDVIRIEEAEFRCIHPSPGYAWKNENNYSLVLQVNYGNFCGIFTGDLECEAEEEILSHLCKADYLKVAHHGSGGASHADFLDRVKPSIAVISAGENNRYGHPVKETLERLKTAGSQIYSTIEYGAVSLYTNGNQWQVRTFCDPNKD